MRDGKHGRKLCSVTERLLNRESSQRNRGGRNVPPAPAEPGRTETLCTSRFCPLRDHPRSTRPTPHRPFLTNHFVASPQQTSKRRRRSLRLMKPLPLLTPTRHTSSTCTNRPAQSHPLNQPMKERDRKLKDRDAEVR